MRRKHSRMMAIILSTIILAGCSNSSHLSVSQTHSSPSATAQPRPTAEPLAVSVSPERSCYQQLYDQPDNPNWALYAEITITNYTDQPLTIETIFLYPNHQFYGEDASTPVLLPEDAIVALRETGLWELHADQISLDSCPVHETWPFGENQLEFPLELEAGQSQTGNIYIPGGTDMTTGLPMAPYTLDVRTSMGDFSYYGMAIAPSGNGWGTYKTSAGRIENIQAAEHLARFLEDSQLLLWLAPSTFVAMESKSTLAADDTIYHAVSATILYLTAQGKIQPLVYQSGIPYYSQEVFEKVLLEMFGQHLDCTGLLQPVQIETHEEEAIPIKYPLAGAAYRVTLLSQQDSSSLYAGTPESAAAPSSDTVASHKKFQEKYGLAFTLLADPERKVIEAYDVWKEKKNYGKVSMGVVRTTYLIDESGIIVRANDKVKAANDAENMLEVV